MFSSINFLREARNHCSVLMGGAPYVSQEKILQNMNISDQDLEHHSVVNISLLYTLSIQNTRIYSESVPSMKLLNKKKIWSCSSTGIVCGAHLSDTRMILIQVFRERRARQCLVYFISLLVLIISELQTTVTLMALQTMFKNKY